MKKILIKLDTIGNYIKENKFYKTQEMIITPMIKDYLAKENIEIIYEATGLEKNINKIDSCDELIKKILKENYNIVSCEEVRKITKKIKEMI